MKKLITILCLSFIKTILAQTPGNGVTDAEGNNYGTVIIGDQEWMSENLRVSQYSNGDLIPNIEDNNTWYGLSAGAFCWMNHDNQNDIPYGKLYNWYTVVDSRNLCPTGWRVPTDSDFATLINFLDPNSNVSVNGIESSIAGGMLKETGVQFWNSPNVDATNSSGFSARGAGARSMWDFESNFNEGTLWWTSSEGQDWEGISRWVHRETGNSGRGFNTKQSGFSVRCMRDGCQTLAPTGSSFQDFCVSAIISDLSVNGNNIQWYDVAIGGNALSPSALLVSGQTYFASQTVNGCESQDRLAVTVSISPNPSTIVNLNNGILTADQGGASYQWLDCDSNFSPITSANQISFSPILTGNYAVEVVLNNCSEISDCYFVEVSSVSVSENSNTNELINLYPNPNNGFFVIENAQIGKYKVVNSIGQTLIHFEIDTFGKKELNVGYAPKGIYYIISDDRSVRPIKLIVN